MKQRSRNMRKPVTCMILGGAIATMTNNTFALSARKTCENAPFKIQGSRQAERLWNPDAETLAAERNGKVFNYSCFTTEEIDRFSRLHWDRIENADFHLIIEPDQNGIDKNEDNAVDEDGY